VTADQFATALRKYCIATQASVTSYGRTQKHNRDVGGDPRSLHQVWKAADVVYDAQLSESERATVAGALGLYVHHESDHDHLRPLDEAWLTPSATV